MCWWSTERQGQPHLLAGLGDQEIVIAHGHIGLKILDELPDLAEPGVLGRKLAQGVEHRGQGGYPMIFIDGQGPGNLHHGVLGF